MSTREKLRDFLKRRQSDDFPDKDEGPSEKQKRAAEGERYSCSTQYFHFCLSYFNLANICWHSNQSLLCYFFLIDRAMY